MLVGQKGLKQFSPMSNEQKETHLVGESSSIDKVSNLHQKNVKSYEIMSIYMKDESGTEKRGGDVDRKSETRFDNLYSLTTFREGCKKIPWLLVGLLSFVLLKTGVKRKKKKAYK